MFNIMRTTVVYELAGAIKPGVLFSSVNMGFKCFEDISGKDADFFCLFVDELLRKTKIMILTCMLALNNNFLCCCDDNIIRKGNSVSV